MTTRIRKVITAIDANGDAFSEQHTETLVDGKWLQSDPTTLVDGSVWAAQYNAALEAANAKLVSDHKTELDAMQAALDEKTQENADNEKRIEDFRAEVGRQEQDKAIYREQITSLQADYDQLNAMQLESTSLIVELQGRLQRLLNELPFDPREISVGAFKARLFSVLETEDVVRLYAAQPDSTLEQIAATITNWDHAFPIRLDSAELLQPLGYLVSINLLTEAEVANLRRDCTRAEAFIATI